MQRVASEASELRHLYMEGTGMHALSAGCMQRVASEASELRHLHLRRARSQPLDEARVQDLPLGRLEAVDDLYVEGGGCMH